MSKSTDPLKSPGTGRFALHRLIPENPIALRASRGTDRKGAQFG